MRIGELAARAGCSVDTLRYYERLGLLPKVARAPNGYREYSPAVLDRLRFIRRAQGFGLDLKEIASLLTVVDSGACPCGHMQEALLRKVEEVSAKIEELLIFRDHLEAYAAAVVPGRGDCGCRVGAVSGDAARPRA